LRDEDLERSPKISKIPIVLESDRNFYFKVAEGFGCSLEDVTNQDEIANRRSITENDHEGLDRSSLPLLI
jgi:hypothetical protein